MEAKALVGGKSANFALGGAIIVSGAIGFWGAYSGIVGAMGWDSPATMQQVAKQLLHDKAATEISHAVAPAIAPKEQSKLPEVTVYQYPANVADPSASFKPDVAASNAGFQEAEKPKSKVEKQHSEPRHEAENPVTKHSEKVAAEKPKAEKHEATTATHAKAKGNEAEKPTASGNWIDDLMPGEPEKKSAYEYEYVAGEDGKGERYSQNGSAWKPGKGLGASDGEFVAAVTPAIKKAVSNGDGHVSVPAEFKPDDSLWSDK